jgi:diguanylate cyclase (GGDEF)-like protein
MSPSNGTAGPLRRQLLRRWTAAVLALTLAALTSAALLGSWRQSQIVRAVADGSARTDAYQHAAYLAATESAVLQASLLEPDGEERGDAAEIGRQTLTALGDLTAADAGQARRNTEMLQLQQALQPAIARYLAALDAGETAQAGEVLEDEIEPLSTALRAGLVAEQQRQIDAYTADLTRAQRDSRVVLGGTALAFLIGLTVLAFLGWSNRSRRRAIERMATHDSLTGLPNRAAFHAHADTALAGRRAGRPTVLMLDLDGFKEVNDNLGHHAGDLLLIEVSRRLRQSVRGQDVVARLGGDEFAVLLSDADPAAGEAAAARIGQAFDLPFVIEGVTLDIEVSIGIMTAEPEQDSAVLLRCADTAMYAAKEHRLGQTRFDPSHAHDTAARLTLLGELRRALETDEFELHYQPKIAVHTGELIGAEALARWRHPVRGLVPPAEFIPVVEGTSLIHRFTARVLELALAQARQWHDAGHRVPVAINVSTRCLLDDGLPDTVAVALHTAGVPGDLLCIEITENTVMADPARAISVLRRIRALGVRTAIDDFGTGYSSMAYLKILPVDEIKVDRSFVQDMATDHSNYVLVESTVDLGHNLGLTVVAEGVEDASTVAALHRVGCDIAQGYHFARPLAAADFTAYLTRHEHGDSGRVSDGAGTLI